MDETSKGATRRHTFFCTNKERHTANENVVDVRPRQIIVFGERVDGWMVTTEEPVLDTVIPLSESLQGDMMSHDSE